MTAMIRIRFASLCLLGLWWPVAGFTASAENPASLPVPLVDVEPVHHELIQHLVVDTYEDWAADLDWERLRTFYAERAFKPVWIEDGAATEKASLWFDVLMHAEEDGLDHREYHSDAIRFLWRAKKERSKARLDLLLTDAFFRFAIEVRAGYQYPRAVDYEWYITPPKVHPVKVLKNALLAEDFAQELARLPPPHQTYRALRAALQRYKSLADQGDWPRVPTGPSLRLGTTHPHVALLRARLLREGYEITETPADENLFDRELERIVKHFQRNNGQEDDGIVGRLTRESLNVSVYDRVEQIIHNMERWRWLPRDLGKRYVMVNMAGYRLYVVENGESVLEMPVIIGKPYKATPAFANAIEYLEFNPTWKVPPSIAKDNFLPKLKENAEFLKANHIRVYENWKPDAREVDPEEVDWSSVSEEDFKFKLEQEAGENNSLGRVKFMFPNSFRVYLHDTPSRGLFEKNVRTFSSGCIRVARPVSLASYLLGEENGWGPREVRELIRKGETQKIDLKQKTPIYLLYYTAWVDAEGNVQFRNDIYKRNRRITAMVEFDSTDS